MSEQLNQEAYHAEFEAAYQKEFPVSVSLMMDKFDRDEHGDYKENCVYTAYHLWQAARRASAPAPADVALPARNTTVNVTPWHERTSQYETPEFSQIERMEAEIADLRAALSRQSSAAPEAMTDDEILDTVVYVDPSRYGLPEGSTDTIDYIGYDLACARLIEAEVQRRCRVQGGNTSEESTGASSAVGIEPVAWRYRHKPCPALPNGGYWRVTDDAEKVRALGDTMQIESLYAAPALADAPQADIDAALNAAVDAEYPIPDNPHASVIQRATDNRAAMWRGINAARKILGVAQPVEQTQKGQTNGGR